MRIKILWIAIFFLLVLVLNGCAGRKYIMKESEINQVPDISQNTLYDVLWCKMHPVLLASEGIGATHHLHLKGNDNPLLGIKVAEKNHQVQLMVISYQNLDLSKKGVISSRSGKHFYSLDGERVYSNKGYLVPKFNWNKIKPISGNKIKVWQNIKAGSAKDTRIKEILKEIGKQLDGREIPGLFDRVMSRAAKITTQDVMIAGATDFHSLFALFGVRAWAIVEAIARKADLTLPYYDTAPVDRFQLAHSIQPLREQLNSLTDKQKEALKKWLEEMEQYQQDRKKWREKYLE